MLKLTPSGCEMISGFKSVRSLIPWCSFISSGRNSARSRGGWRSSVVSVAPREGGAVDGARSVPSWSRLAGTSIASTSYVFASSTFMSSAQAHTADQGDSQDKSPTDAHTSYCPPETSHTSYTAESSWSPGTSRRIRLSIHRSIALRA